MVVLFDLELEPQTELKMVTKITKLWCVSCPLFPFHCHTYLLAVNRQVRFGNGLLSTHTLPCFQFLLPE